MARLEELTRSATVRGVLPDGLVTVVDVKWHGSSVVELTYKDAACRPATNSFTATASPPWRSHRSENRGASTVTEQCYASCPRPTASDSPIFLFDPVVRQK